MTVYIYKTSTFSTSYDIRDKVFNGKNWYISKVQTHISNKSKRTTTYYKVKLSYRTK